MAARKQTSTKKTHTPVEATVHQDKRANIPTADAQDFLPPEAEQPKTLLYPRDPSLDPQLVWKGKDEQDAHDLEVVAPPIFIQEKIDPRVLIENLRQTSKAGEAEPELTLFDSFDGLDGFDIVDFYQHEANWSNRMILGDSLQVMASLAEREGLRGKVQMIYIDPPYGIKFGSNWQVSTRKRTVHDGKLEDASFEVEQIKAFRDTWELGIHSYLSYLRDRLVAARELLTDSGSCFVQIGDENVHLVRSLMDEVFGSENFVSQIVLQTTQGAGSQVGTTVIAAVHSYVLWYAYDRSSLKYRQLYDDKSLDTGSGAYDMVQLIDGSVRRLESAERTDPALIPRGGRVYTADNMTSQSQRSDGQFPVTVGDTTVTLRTGYWKTNREGMQRLALADRLIARSNSIRYRRFLDDFPVSPIHNVWTDVAGQYQFGGEKVYVVQTALKIVQRCVLMATDPGDLVLDPTCGSGTTSFVAEQWGRRWITVDTSRVALALARQRLMGARYPFYVLSDSAEGQRLEATLISSAPALGSPSHDVRRGFVYGRAQHITLRSIANNPDIKEGMGRQEIEAAIRRHADYELLYDKPHEDKSKVRVAGPFTVESLSPHRSLAFAGEVPDDLPKSKLVADQDVGSASFEGMILENLGRAGIQNGRRNERLNFASVDSYAGDYVQAVGETKVDDGAELQRIGIAIGPQYGTVGPPFIKNAAREALKADPRLDLLAVLAFSFDPQALGADQEYVSSTEGFADVAAERNLGRLPVLLVRMNNDLVMGDDLKKTASGNLFTVFGEPDIDIRVDGDEVTVEILGVDVYDPSTGEVRSRDTDHIALWMIDTNYNEESFFVRHCYFTGGNDPYERLKRALKADIDEDAWATLYQTVSRPFPKPETGKIAVKVINDYGDEVMQVFQVD
ncbi:MAG: site-specific DNA-methyltransferase [Acidimicrobiales bacterium]|nr:site-specific DNA-methyltransferase [Acidimicrobiales bacterium]MCB9382775.1 site-specific DNA-methyltransferase [Acidimicrobiaceae bacterium]